MSFPFVPLEFTEYPPEEMRRRASRFYAEMRQRRTVREFSNRDVDREIVKQAILTAGTAPSGAHKQPWRFALIGDAEIKRQIRAAAEVEERENYEHRMPQAWIDDLAPLGTDWRKPFLTICPWLVVVFAQIYGVDEPDNPKSKHYYVQESVGIATGLLLTALHHSGLATLTHTPSPMGFLHRILDRPENERAYMLVAVGYPDPGCTVPKLRRKSLEEILDEV